MSKSSFADIDQITEAADSAKPVAPAPSQAIATKAETAVVPDNFFSNEGMEGEFTREDLQIPGLNLVHGVGDLSEHFVPGSMVFNKEDILIGQASEKGQPVGPVYTGVVEITLLRMKKFFQERLPFGSDVMPKRWDTSEAARAEGYFPLFEKRDAPEDAQFFQPVLDCQVLVRGDKERHAATFPLDYEGTPYALARFRLQSIAYTAAGQAFITASQFGLRKGLFTGFWQITPKREKYGTNWIWVPRVKLVGKHSEAFVAWIAAQI